MVPEPPVLLLSPDHEIVMDVDKGLSQSEVVPLPTLRSKVMVPVSPSCRLPLTGEVLTVEFPACHLIVPVWDRTVTDPRRLYPMSTELVETEADGGGGGGGVGGALELCLA